MSENYTKVQQAFRVLHPLLAGYICQEMRREYQDNWWQEVLMTLSDQVRDLPDDNGDYAALMDSLDMANCLRLFDRKWNDLFKRKLSIDYRTWAKELMGVRNKLAHIGGDKEKSPPEAGTESSAYEWRARKDVYCNIPRLPEARSAAN